MVDDVDTLVFRSDGPCMGTICAPMFLTAQEIVDQCNEMSPPKFHGSPGSFWQPTSGEPPHPCPTNPQRVHYLLSC